jgi:hypothetical protein
LICFVKVGSVSKAEFLAMGLAGVQVGYGYYTGKYNTLGGELYALKRAYQGAGVFDPKKLRELPIAPLEFPVDLLANFEFPKATEEFLAGMKAELPEVIRNAKQPFDYSEMEGVAEYDAALVQACRKRTAAAAPAAAAAAPAAPAPAPAAAAAPVRVPTFNTWEDDPMETARRTWEWCGFASGMWACSSTGPWLCACGPRANAERPDRAGLFTAQAHPRNRSATRPRRRPSRHGCSRL